MPKSTKFNAGSLDVEGGWISALRGGRDRVTGVAYLEDNHGDGWFGFERMDLEGERKLM